MVLDPTIPAKLNWIDFIDEIQQSMNTRQQTDYFIDFSDTVPQIRLLNN